MTLVTLNSLSVCTSWKCVQASKNPLKSRGASFFDDAPSHQGLMLDSSGRSCRSEMGTSGTRGGRIPG